VKLVHLVGFITKKNLQLLTALNCAIYSMMCRSSVVEVVSKVKVCKIVTLVNTFSDLDLQHQPLCTELKLLFIIYIFK